MCEGWRNGGLGGGVGRGNGRNSTNCLTRWTPWAAESIDDTVDMKEGEVMMGGQLGGSWGGQWRV